MTDLLARTAELVGIPSVSFNEDAIADHVERRLRPIPGLVVTRVGRNPLRRDHGFEISRQRKPPEERTGAP